MPVLDLQALIDDRVAAIRNFHQHTGAKRAELDISGGVDSATMLGLLVRALDPDSITAVYIGIHSSDASRSRAREVCAAYGVRLIDLDITASFDQLVAQMRAGMVAAGWSADELEARIRREPVVLGSIRSCLRAPIGRGCNRLAGGGIRHGTGNECEDRWLRFYQKGGDGEVDTNPIAMLAKGEIYQLARALAVPRSILDALPSPDLHGVGDKHNDEDELRQWSGVDWTYSRLDDATGEYAKVGTIEIMSRFLDLHPELFRDAALPEPELSALAREAEPHFARSHAVVMAFLESCRAIERMTRHKANPNCPALGSRAPLVQRGILTNTLPRL
ncbi:NAD(+) synthase [Nannocystaceae bacterium ST9]